MRSTPVEKEQAPEPVRQVYETMEQKGVRVSNFFKILGHWPEVLRGFTKMYNAVWSKTALPQADAT